MRNPLIIALASSLIAIAPVGAEPAPGAKADRSKAGADLLTAAKAFDAGNCEEAIKYAGKSIDRNDKAALPEQARAIAFQIESSCEEQLDRGTDAYRHAFAGTALAAIDDATWRRRLLYELRDHRNEAAVATVEAMTNGRGAALNSVPSSWYYQFSTQLKTAGAADLRRRLLAILAGDGYDPDEPGATRDGFRHDYAEILYESGDHDAAGLLIRQIVYPSLLADISLDKRFRDFLPADFDLRKSVERALAESRALSAQHPDLIQPLNDVATFLQVLGRPQESLDALEPLRSSINDDEKLTDRDEQRVWWWDGVSRGERILGHNAQAAEALRKGGEAEENGGLNVSQVINLSELQMNTGHPAEALATLRVFDTGKRDVSPFGMMQITLNRGCAKTLIGKPADAAAEIAFARAHAKDAPAALTELLLCIGDIDSAAASLISRLGDAETRTAALRTLSIYDEPPVKLPAEPGAKAFDEVKARADVQAAIARAGGIRRFHVQKVTF